MAPSDEPIRTPEGLPAHFERLSFCSKGPIAERWRAFDAVRQEWLSVVFLYRSEPGSDRRVERAYRFLATTDSPHLPHALDFGRRPDGSPWFSFEAVEDVEAPAAADEATLRAWAVAGARALVEAHRAGLLHRSIAPVAFQQSADGQLLLSYWIFNGLTDEPDGLVTGVVPYMAPEALAGAPVSASDFYALGAVLYALATGQPPHGAAAGLALMQAQRQGAPSLAAARPDLSAELVRAVDRLLAHDPGDRPPDGLALLAALGAPLLPSVNSPAVDHEVPLERLLKAYESFRRRSGGAVVLTGPTGAGKRMLLRRFAAEVALRGGLIADTRPEPGGDRLGALAAWLDRRGASAPIEPPEGAMPAAARQILLAAALASRLAHASAQDGMVLLFEHLGAHEEETLLRLERLLAAYGSQVLVVVSVSGEEATGGKVLARLKRNPLVRELPLASLSARAARRVAALALGPTAPGLELVEAALAAAAGHPLMLIETLRALVADGQLELGPGGWQQARPAGPLPLAPSLEAVFRARLEALPPAARRLGAVVALLDGVEASRALVASALERAPTPELGHDFQALVVQRWLSREEGGYRLAHALMRAVLVGCLSPEEQRAVHARLACRLAELAAPVEAIARHWAAAGRRAEAAGAYERAAAEAEARGAVFDAFRCRREAYRLTDDVACREQLAERLIRSGATIDPTFCADVLEASLAGGRALAPTERLLRRNRLAMCWSFAGRIGEARALLDTSLAEAEGAEPGLVGMLLATRALLEGLQGRIGEARAVAATALERLEALEAGRLTPQGAAFSAIAAVSARSTASAYRMFVGEPTRLDDARALAEEMARRGLGDSSLWPYLTAAHGFAYEGRLGPARSALAAVRDGLERVGIAPIAQAAASAIETLIAVRAGELDQALRDGAAAVAYARTQSPYPDWLGLTLVAYAEALLAMGHTSQAEAAAAEALQLTAPDNAHLAGLAELLLAEAIGRRHPAEAERRIEAVLLAASAPETLNRYVQARAWRQLGECRQALGQREEALSALTRALADAERHDWPYLRVQALLALARHHKAHRRFGRLQHLVPRALQAAEAHGYAELARQARTLSRFSATGLAPLTELRRLLEHRGAFSELVEQGLELARAQARADRAAIYLLDGDRRPRLVGAHPPGVDPLISGQGLIATVLSEGRTAQREGAEPLAPGAWLIDAEVRALLAIPLQTPRGPLGVLYLDRRTLEEPFTRGEVSKLEALAAYLALAIDRPEHAPGAAGAALDGRVSTLETALSELLEADRVRRGFLATLTADLRHQLAQVHAALGIVEEGASGLEGAFEALEHAERLAEILERGIRE